MKKSNGFTLIELLVVVAIIGILISLAFPVISRMRESAKRVAAQSDIRSIEVATDQYYAQYRRLPIPNEAHGPPHQFTWRDMSYRTRPQGYGVPGGAWHVRTDLIDNLTHVSWRLALCSLATLQGANEFEGEETGFNPREIQFLERQEGRPLGHFMDPWSKGTSVFEDRVNMLYGLIFDSNLDGKMGNWEVDRVEPGRFITGKHFWGRSAGPNRKTEERVDAKDFDDVYTPEIQAIFEDLLYKN